MSLMAESGFMRDVNTACGEIAVECSSCHNINDFDEYRDAQGIYESSGACAFCSADAICSPVRLIKEELLADARDTTNQYFETLFKKFMQHLQAAGGDFVEVFPDCPEIAPIKGSNISKDKGYLARRVTNRTRNARNTPDSWEAKQLEGFEKMAEKGKPRTQFDIIKPDGSILPTKGFEATSFVNEKDVEYFRYMRSITMPGPPNEAPFLPCLKCHGTFDQLADGLVEKGSPTRGYLRNYILTIWPWDTRKAISAVPGRSRFPSWKVKTRLFKNQYTGPWSWLLTSRATVPWLM